jgi:hypothetical protein
MEQYVFDNHQGGACHEAGHAVISWALGRRLIRVSIVRNAEGDGCTDHVFVLSPDGQFENGIRNQWGKCGDEYLEYRARGNELIPVPKFWRRPGQAIQNAH